MAQAKRRLATERRLTALERELMELKVAAASVAAPALSEPRDAFFSPEKQPRAAAPRTAATPLTKSAPRREACSGLRDALERQSASPCPKYAGAAAAMAVALSPEREDSADAPNDKELAALSNDDVAMALMSRFA
jgi:hypothetical protein